MAGFSGDKNTQRTSYIFQSIEQFYPILDIISEMVHTCKSTQSSISIFYENTEKSESQLLCVGTVALKQTEL